MDRPRVLPWCVLLCMLLSSAELIGPPLQTCAFVSLLTGACVPTNVAMTGEVTLRGRVGPVGGIKEKVLGAHRAQVTKVILPWANRKDVEHDVPLEVRTEMQFVFVRTMEEVLEAAFGKGVLNWRGNMVVMESRL